VDNSGRPNETEMIDGEPYSLDELKYKRNNDSDWDCWFDNLSKYDQYLVLRLVGRFDPVKKILVK